MAITLVIEWCCHLSFTQMTCPAINHGSLSITPGSVAQRCQKKGVYNNNAYSLLITKNVILMVPSRQQNFTQ